MSLKAELGYRNGVADGLIVARLSDGGTFVASLEAKAANTRPDLLQRFGKGREDFGKLHAHALLAAGLVFVGTAVIPWMVGSSSWKWTSPPLAFGLVYVLYVLVAPLLTRTYWAIPAVRQAQDYPADEQWLALSEDVWGSLDDIKRNNLKNACVKKGVGLLLVNSRKEPEILREPRRQVLPGDLNSFFDCYDGKVAERMRRELGGQAETEASATE